MNSQEEKIVVSIVDDDESFSQCIRLMVDGNPGMTCKSQYLNGLDAIDGIPRDQPDVVLMDLQMPGMTGVECIRRLRPIMSDTLFVVLTSHTDDERVFESLEAGASGYLLKRSAPVEILQAILEVLSGGAPMSSYIARRVVESFLSGSRSRIQSQCITKLSVREEEILKLLAQGYLYKEIADQLSISLDTVRTHIRRIYEKLHVRSRTEAVVKFLGK